MSKNLEKKKKMLDWIQRSSSLWVLRNFSNHMIRQARIGDTVLVTSREMTDGTPKHCRGSGGVKRGKDDGKQNTIGQHSVEFWTSVPQRPNLFWPQFSNGNIKGVFESETTETSIIDVVVSHNYNPFLQNFPAILAEEFSRRVKNSGLMPNFQIFGLKLRA